MTTKAPVKNKPKRFVLTRSNYYSIEADRRLMSVSQYKDFIKCEASTMAKLNGTYERPSVQAFLEGNFLHSWAESPQEHEKFIKDNWELLHTTRGKKELYAVYKKIQLNVIPNLEADEKFMKIINECEKEKIIRAKFLGIEWKARIDLYNADKKYFVDLKYINNLFKAFFNKEKETYVNFVENYGYDIQMNVYAELDKRKHHRKELFNPYILAVSKEENPTKMLIGNMLQNHDEIVEKIKVNLERINLVKAGTEEPKGCGRCDYCRANSEMIGYNYLEIPID